MTRNHSVLAKEKLAETIQQILDRRAGKTQRLIKDIISAAELDGQILPEDFIQVVVFGSVRIISDNNRIEKDHKFEILRNPSK